MAQITPTEKLPFLSEELLLLGGNNGSGWVTSTTPQIQHKAAKVSMVLHEPFSKKMDMTAAHSVEVAARTPAYAKLMFCGKTRRAQRCDKDMLETFYRNFGHKSACLDLLI